ncbi:ParB N-terminal domain-containing protein [Anaeromyxobacter oryzisoli]|uniref:ParB N-terminal domain-containing protein n=1 Tax=Anaeromyxobacter oryzisoli TaxID=2925408 RepID=UPI001F55FDC6|nr:ParB N-terminal domain-containing protein [Anaeromyxobacter sp. SG63]
MELEPRTVTPVHATGAVEFVPLSAVADDVTFRLREEGDVAALAGSIGRLGQLAPVELRPIPDAPPGAPRFQVVDGFRRIAALRLLMRERVLARVHRTLDDDDAWGLALGHALLTEPLDRDALRRLRERLLGSGAAPWADDLLDEALVRAPVEPELRERFFEFLGGASAPGEVEEVAVETDTDPGAAGRDADELERAAGSPAAEPAGDADADLAGLEAEPEPEAEEVEVEVTPEELVEDLAARLYQVNADLAVAFDAWAELPAQGRLAILEQVRWMANLLPHLEGDGEGR